MIPKALILFPATDGFYGVVEIREDDRFFSTMRLHLQHVTDVAKASADEPVLDWREKWTSLVLYDTLTSNSSWCSFIEKYPEEDFEEDSEGNPIFRGVEDFASLLACTIDNVMNENCDVEAQLDNSEGEGRPVVINFKEWYENCASNGWFKGTIEDFHARIQDLYLRTELDRLVLDLPIGLEVVRRGPVREYGRVNISFRFTGEKKHSDEVIETMPVVLNDFIGPFEDAVRSLR